MSDDPKDKLTSSDGGAINPTVKMQDEPNTELTPNDVGADEDLPDEGDGDNDSEATS
jgi:hypothetical protein